MRKLEPLVTVCWLMWLMQDDVCVRENVKVWSVHVALFLSTGFAFDGSDTFRWVRSRTVYFECSFLLLECTLMF